METTSAIIVAGGSGRRFGQKKQFIKLAGKSILDITVGAFENRYIDKIVVVVPEENVAETQISLNKSGREVTVVSGGDARHNSVINGLKAAGDCNTVLIHDGVRPFVTEALIKRLIDGIGDADGCVPVLPVTDTIKTVEKDMVRNTVPRESLYSVQTPQAFRMEKIIEAHIRAESRKFIPTDDSILIEESGGMVKIVEGERFNIKITLPEDMILAEAIYAFQNRNGI